MFNCSCSKQVERWEDVVDLMHHGTLINVLGREYTTVHRTVLLKLLCINIVTFEKNIFPYCPKSILKLFILLTFICATGLFLV